MADILRCTDVWGQDVRLTKNCWEMHILTNHPELRGCDQLLATVLSDPNQVNQDVNDLDVKNFYRAFILPPPYDRTYVKICVKYRDRVSGPPTGEVITAYSTQDLKGGEKQLWP